jgi:hypothetical protein
MTTPRTAPARRLDDQTGAGLMLAMGIGLLLIAMGALAFSLFNIGQNSAKRHLGYEQAIHVAENGIDTALAEQQASEGTWHTDDAWDDVSTTTVEEGQLPAGTDTVEEEEAWLRQRALYAETGSNFAALTAAGVAGTSSEGDYVLVSPSNRKTVYAVGWVPSIANAEHVRYIKTEWLFSTWRPDHAVLVDGDLDLSGAVVAGLTGNVHSNGNTSVQVNSTDISGLLSTSGTFSTTGGSLPNPPDIANVEAGSAQQDVPDFDPRLIWERGTAVTDYRTQWYDLCPDGQVHTVSAGQSEPCDGPAAADFVSGSDYRGWGWKSSTKTWDYKSDDTSDGVYYAYQANMDISGNPGLSSGTPWKASLIAEAKEAGADSNCSTTREEGDIKVTGTPRSIPFMTGLGYIAGRDLKINGNPSSGTGTYTGFYAAGEQVEVGGNVSITGSIVVQDLCDTGASTINDNNVHGSVTITYDGGLDILVGATIRSVLWLEL